MYESGAKIWRVFVEKTDRDTEKNEIERKERTKKREGIVIKN